MIIELMIQHYLTSPNIKNIIKSRKIAYLGAKFFLAPCFFMLVCAFSWEQRKLSDMVERVTRKNENLESELPLTISAQYGLIDQNEFFDKRIASRDVSGYYLLKKGEFAYNKSTSSDAPWGAVKRLDRYEMGVLSTLYIVFALKEDGNIDSDFLVSYYDTDCWHKGVQAIAAEGARNHGLLNITPADYFETVLTVPSDVKEQHQIGTFFAKLDTLITLHQRECFSFDFGSRSAKVAQKTISWEQREFSKFTFPAGEKNKNDLPLEPYAITNEHGFIAQSEAHDDFGYMQNVDRTMYIIVKPNSFAYNPARINVGSLGYYEGTENVIVSSLYEVFQTADYVDDVFLNYWFKTKNFMDWIAKLQEGSVRQYFYYDKLCECKMSMPSVDEQQQIGTYFRNLDHLITLHQRKLEPLKKMKKSMLQKMFI